MLGVLNDGFTLQGINAFMFNIIVGAGDPFIAMVANIHWRGGAPTENSPDSRCDWPALAGNTRRTRLPTPPRSPESRCTIA